MMNSGYVGYSRSKRAAEAEAEGKLPLSRFVKAIRPHFTGITAADVRAVMAPCEWHHTSKRANATDYYDLAEILPDHERNECPHDAPCGDTLVCDACDRRETAEELQGLLHRQMFARKLLAKLLRRHGVNGRLMLTMEDGTPWHWVEKGDVRHLGRVLIHLEHGRPPRSHAEEDAAVAAAMQEAR